MRFQLASATYESDQLESLGFGSFGEVFDLKTRLAAKLYHVKPDGERTRKLIQLFDIGASVASDRQIGSAVAMPLEPAVSIPDKALTGYSMHCYRNWVPVSSLTFDYQRGEYKQHSGFRFNDETAVKTVFFLFNVLSALGRRHIAIGDISGKNVLIDPKTGMPGLIDMDSVHFEDWESESLGTAGYIDPNLMETDLNASGGLHFDSKSDVFALTVLAFYLTLGIMPFYFAVRPPLSDEEFARKRLSSLRIAVQGEACLRPHGLTLAGPEFVDYVKQRTGVLRKVRGTSGSDGELLYQHFVDVLVHDGRENLVEKLPDEDSRNPAYDLVRPLRGLQAIDELDEKFGLKQRRAAVLAQRQAVAVQIPVAARRNKPYLAKDPLSLGAFLRTRKIDLGAITG